MRETVYNGIVHNNSRQLFVIEIKRGEGKIDGNFFTFFYKVALFDKKKKKEKEDRCIVQPLPDTAQGNPFPGRYKKI
jgi:hypothetical protein